MNLQEILSIAFATLLILVVAHFCVYYVVRTLYPPAPAPAPSPAPFLVAAQPPPIPKTNFEPPRQVEQHVDIPTYETPVSLEAPRQEGSTNLENLLQDSTVQRDTRVDSTQPQ
jgi:hypothetical protein